VERLGWTLVSFLWQGTLIAALYAAARSCARSTSPNTRYLVACAALVLMIAAPLITWSLIGRPSNTPQQAYTAGQRPIDASPAPTTPVFPGGTYVPQVPAPTLTFVVAVWLTGRWFCRCASWEVGSSLFVFDLSL
jgi:hypothetical protein